jgi:hypothetical protein
MKLTHNTSLHITGARGSSCEHIYPLVFCSSRIYYSREMSVSDGVSDLTFFYIAKENTRFTVELDLWAQLISVSDGMDAWRNDTALVHPPTKQRLTAALRQGRVTIQNIIINPSDPASTLNLCLPTVGDKLSCECPGMSAINPHHQIVGRGNLRLGFSTKTPTESSTIRTRVTCVTYICSVVRASA